MRQDSAYEGIAREHGRTAELIRQIVSKTLQKRDADDGRDAEPQLARLERVNVHRSRALASGVAAACFIRRRSTGSTAPGKPPPPMVITDQDPGG